MLDAVVNKQGGYLRKTSTTLAHMAKHRREELRKVMRSVLDTPPFDALPADMAETVAGMLRPVQFKQGQVVLGAGDEPSQAYIVLEGEVDVEISGKPETTFGPGSLVGVLPLFVPGLSNIATITAKSDLKCLALNLEDFNHLRALSFDFDKACRSLAGKRMDQLDKHVTTRLQEAAEWTHAAAAALRLGQEAPALTVRRAHAEHKGSPLAVWLGILLNGIPESIVIGAGLFMMIAVHPAADSLRFVEVIPFTLIAGLFLSNFPEALSSSANMIGAGWTRRKVFTHEVCSDDDNSVGDAVGFLWTTCRATRELVFAKKEAAAPCTIPLTRRRRTENPHGKIKHAGRITCRGAFKPRNK